MYAVIHTSLGNGADVKGHIAHKGRFDGEKRGR
jgi:hypothetical protein